MEAWQRALLIGGLMALALVLPSLVTGIVPTRWPKKPIHRHEKPRQFWTVVSIWSVAAAVALLLALINFVGG